jgi:hypothetical protein
MTINIINFHCILAANQEGDNQNYVVETPEFADFVGDDYSGDIETFFSDDSSLDSDFDDECTRVPDASGTEILMSSLLEQLRERSESLPQDRIHELIKRLEQGPPLELSNTAVESADDLDDTNDDVSLVLARNRGVRRYRSQAQRSSSSSMGADDSLHLSRNRVAGQQIDGDTNFDEFCDDFDYENDDCSVPCSMPLKEYVLPLAPPATPCAHRRSSRSKRMQKRHQSF